VNAPMGLEISVCVCVLGGGASGINEVDDRHISFD